MAWMVHVGEPAEKVEHVQTDAVDDCTVRWLLRYLHLEQQQDSLRARDAAVRTRGAVAAAAPAK